VTVAYELDVITSVTTDVLHNVAVGHPFRDHGEPSVLEGIRNPDKTKDVGMGQVLPYGNFFTEALYGVSELMKGCSLVSDLADPPTVV